MRMHKLNFLASGLSLLFCLVFSSALFAQGQQAVKTDFSDQELEQFIDVNKVVVEVQQSAEQEMMNAIQETDGITLERFNEIAMAQQNPDADVSMSDDEKMAFQNAAEGVMEVQRETQAKIAAAVEDEGMAFTDYRQIMMAYQQSPELQEKIRSMVQEQQN